MPHIEVPIQAGDDEILRMMRRGYTNSQYRDLVARIRERIPGVSIGTDIIVGFPGESEAAFMKTTIPWQSSSWMSLILRATLPDPARIRPVFLRMTFPPKRRCAASEPLGPAKGSGRQSQRGIPRSKRSSIV
jgi:radical SAM superfamily enzyme YgiQ (UPF0313 family)